MCLLQKVLFATCLCQGGVRRELFYTRPVHNLENKISLVSFRKWGQLLRKEFATRWGQILSFNSSPCYKGKKCILKNLLPDGGKFFLLTAAPAIKVKNVFYVRLSLFVVNSSLTQMGNVRKGPTF